MATSSWLKVFPTTQPPIVSTTNRPFSLNALNPRKTSSEFPLASKIVVKNLSYSITESCLKREFSNFGQIAEVELIKDRATRKSKGYAFIQYTSQDEAMLALESMDEKNFEGRVIYVELAKPSIKDVNAYPKSSGMPIEDDPYY